MNQSEKIKTAFERQSKALELRAGIGKGTAVTKVKITGVEHEFSTLPNVKEDIVDLLLNVKQLRVKLHEGDEATLVLKAKGETVVKAVTYHD